MRQQINQNIIKLNNQFSFIILTFNEEIHLPRLLSSIKALNAEIFILDSGSTDSTLEIANNFGAIVLTNPFENHPKQWDFALHNFQIKTPWIVCLDADQVVTPELFARLESFKNEDFEGIDGIYFNRKNYFKGKWIKHGGYFPFYLLKMIRFGAGFSDLNENMDHRFIVPGKTIIWKDGYLLEENLKENKISFWINKHNRYSDLVAIEEVERMQKIRQQTIKPNFWGSPDSRTAWLKQLWWQLPRYARPSIYFFYRIFFKLGILDGNTGVIFHFLQGFWFRLIVDVKIDEILKKDEVVENNPSMLSKIGTFKFILSFLILFLAFDFFNKVNFSLTSPGSKHYWAFAANYLNYIHHLRFILLYLSSKVLGIFGYSSIFNEYYLLVAGHGALKLVYSCLGLALISFYSAFVIAYPKKIKSKIGFLIGGIFGIEILNIVRFVLLGAFGNKNQSQMFDHHTIFNLIIYILIIVSIYFWVKADYSTDKKNGTNRPINL